MDPVTLKSNVGVAPPASDTIIVSPMARETAKTTEAMIPDNAAGKITFSETSNFVAPKAKAPSLIEFGTELIASSDKDAIIGKIIIPTTIPGLSALNIFSDGINS